MDSFDKSLTEIAEAFQEQKEAHAQEIAKLEAEINDLKELYSNLEKLQYLSKYLYYAERANLSLDAWVRMQLDESIKSRCIPVSEEIYNKLVGVATGQNISLASLTTTKAMEVVINTAIENQKLLEGQFK